MKKTIALTMALGLTLGACLSFSACKKENIPAEEITVFMPDGAPALAFAELMHEDKEDDGVTYRVVNTSTEAGVLPLVSQLTNADAEKNADFCVLPLTAAVQKCGTGEAYALLGLVTQGNLYLVSKDSAQYDKNNVADLKGKTVVVKQMLQVPGQTLKAALERNGVEWSTYEGGEKQADKVNLAAQADSYDLEVLAEPAVSKRLGMNAGWNVVGDLQELYGDCGLGNDGYPQAVLIAKKEFVNERVDWTKTFVEKIAAGKEWLYTATAEDIYGAVEAHGYEAGQTPLFSVENLSVETRRRCGIQFTYAMQARTAIEGYLTETGGALPNAAFYWEYQK